MCNYSNKSKNLLVYEYYVVQIDVNMGSRNYQNLKVYVVDEEGETKMIKSVYMDGTLSFEAYSLGDVIIVADDLRWLDIASLASILLLLSIGVVIALIKMSKNKKLEKQK